MEKIEINLQFKIALDWIDNSNRNVFITGCAGTGKSTLLSYFREHTLKSVVILAPTGVAALNVQGATIHSFFRFKSNITVEDASKQASRIRDVHIYKNIDMIIIDEVSMVRADLLDCMDVFLRTVLKNNKPFGSIQIVFIGDLYQLPPVVTTRDREHFRSVYDGPFFFSAHVMTDGQFNLEYIELKKVYRQHDSDFIVLLNALRNRTVTESQMTLLNKRMLPEYCDEEYIYLTSTNKNADDINTYKLSQLKAKNHVFDADIQGDFDPKIAPSQTELKIRARAQVMFLNNDSSGLWVNGTLGEVKSIKDDEITVRTQDNKLVQVSRYKWNLYRYTYDKETNKLSQETIGSFKQFPLKLAWAITIHKSQGKTFNKVIIDVGQGAFAHGQVYVALSRCRTYEGIILKKPLKKSHVIMDYQVEQFLTQYDASIEKDSQQKEKCSTQEKINLIKSSIDSGELLGIVYLNAKNQKSVRKLYPVNVGEMEYKGSKFIGMKAFCENRQYEWTFRVDRILSFQ